MTDFTKYIPKTCTTHHHACDCREAMLQGRIDALTAAAGAVIRWQKANAPGWCLTGVFKSLEEALLEAEK